VHVFCSPTNKPSIEHRVACENGQSGEYSCENVDLLSFVSVADMATDGTNDIWGWTDPEGGQEIALVALRDGTSFVDISNPTEPCILGKLDTHTTASSWRDIKVYQNVAYIGSEANNHGMQIVDMTELRQFYGQCTVGANMRQITATGHYDEFGSSHNLVLNEATGFLYSVGSTTCSSGPHIVDIREPLNPQFVGCYGEDGYTHDAECVTYTGPDTEFQGQEICFAYNENTLTIISMADHNNPEMLSRVTYDNVYYTHQGWLTEDQTHLFLDDELDESRGPEPRTRTMIWDVRSLRNAELVDSFFSEFTVIDHNQYVLGDFVYQSNYCAGLQVLAIDRSGEHPVLTRAGYFDNAPDCSTPVFQGSWSNYPYFASGNIIFTSIERGLYVVDASLAKKMALAGKVNGTVH
jgi:choice-of-anchor B domain-containing protein